ncbi:glucosaminidase domain-containing protein [Mucilaginibacter sp. JRF]|uniref:glycoside hydrolase family 73 protein n=1 Tax=Mucilaginibacter sp. JRF TaxID=2780088 RepID=UPI001880EFD6|nr:glucosaminidase domain-containing protein [Mucilaginibacter sp. JRF]MBE9586529.1 glucosaminidase domain-containing protein [Mucilaginibacter sp. JRF]
MKKLLLVILFSIFSVAATFAQQTSQSYIEQFKDNAISIMHETGIPASIIMAVAMHESGNGNSTIAKKLNNQFGIKGNTRVVYYKKKRKVRTSYKKYGSVLESFEDFARVLTERKQFSHLGDKFTQYEYKGWAKGIQRSGYCSSKKWSAQVIGIIKRYGLHELDSVPEPKQMAQNTEK